VLVAAEVQQVELIDEAVAFSANRGAVDGDTMNAGIDFWARSRIAQRPNGVRRCHDFEQDFSLAA